jgi:serine phosphatase RsbU (regulator of sigma subunit)
MLNSGVTLTPTALLNGILVDLDRFVGTAPQHDDVTCMLVKVT